MDENPLFDGWDVVDNGHAGACCVLVVGDVVDGGLPRLQVVADLVRELLAVFRVALVGVVDDDGAVVVAGWGQLLHREYTHPHPHPHPHPHHIRLGGAHLQNERLPDRSLPVRSIRSPALRNTADKLPRPPPVKTCIQINPGTRVTDAVARRQYGAHIKPAQGNQQFRNRRLPRQPKPIHLVREIRDIRPACAAVGALEDREVRWFRARQGGCGEDGSVLQLGEARVGYGLVAGGLEDGVVDEEAEGFGRGGVGLGADGCGEGLRDERDGDGQFHRTLR